VQANKSFYDEHTAFFTPLYAVFNGQAPDEIKQAHFSGSAAFWDGIDTFTIQTPRGNG
jgi:hypothetical protein